MALKKRDWLFIAILVAVLGIFIAISGERPRRSRSTQPIRRSTT